MKEVYADHAATTRLSKTALEAMLPFLTEQYGNPSSIHRRSKAPRLVIETARRRIAEMIGAQASELTFTSGGTEADNWAILSAAQMMEKEDKRHIITSSVEHHAVRNTISFLETQRGFSVTWLPVGADGIIRISDLEAAIRPDTALVSIMTANNELGTLMPVEEIGMVCRDKGVLFHTDAVQAFCQIPLNVAAIAADMLTISAHKVGGPKGVGALYVRKNIDLPPFLHGGSQERGNRPGTENVPGIAGFEAAAAERLGQMEENRRRVTALRSRLTEGIMKIPHSRLNGDPENRLPGIANFTFEGVEGESLLLMMDMNGISASAGSACSSGSMTPSHVLVALGLPPEMVQGSIRFSLGPDNTKDDVDTILEVLPPLIEKLRKMSPLWKNNN